MACAWHAGHSDPDGARQWDRAGLHASVSATPVEGCAGAAVTVLQSLIIRVPIVSLPVYTMCSWHVLLSDQACARATDVAALKAICLDSVMPLQISVGRLGVITELDFKIIPQQLLTRTLDNLTFSEYQSWLTSIQNTYKAALRSGDPSQISAALKPLDRTQVGTRPCCNLQVL